ncbi:hypothetical protein ACFLZB_00410 [Nanoarchaeota archaeon]
MALEDKLDRLTETCMQFYPDTIQHSDEITNERRIDESLRDKSYWTADFALYMVEDGKPVLYLARGKENIIFENTRRIKSRTNKSAGADAFFVTGTESVQSVINSKDTLRIEISDLNLIEDKRYEDKSTYFKIHTFNYELLNETQRKFAERLFGQGDDFNQNMEMFKQAGVNKIRIYVLIPKEGEVIARACSLGSFGKSCSFYAEDQGISGALAYTRGEPLPEGMRQVTLQSTLNNISEAYKFLQADEKRTIAEMTPERAAFLSRILESYRGHDSLLTRLKRKFYQNKNTEI